MALFTSSEANACKIITTRLETENSSKVWYVRVQDGNRPYEFMLAGLGESPSTTAIKSKVLEELLKVERKNQRDEVVPEIIDKGVGETLG